MHAPSFGRRIDAGSNPAGVTVLERMRCQLGLSVFGRSPDDDSGIDFTGAPYCTLDVGQAL